MTAVTPRYLVDENQQSTDVVLTIGQWHQILDELEQLEDIKAYDEAKAGSQEAVPLQQAIREIREGRQR